MFGIVIASRIVGQQLHAGMADFPVALALVVDNTLMRDSVMDFSKAVYVAVAAITDRSDATEPKTPDHSDRVRHLRSDGSALGRGNVANEASQKKSKGSSGRGQQ